MKNKTLPLAGLMITLLLSACSRTVPVSFDENSLFQGINFVGVSVSDLDEASARYSNATALVAVKDMSLAKDAVITQLDTTSGDISARLMRGTNAQLLFMHFETGERAEPSPVPVQGPGIAHVAFQVNKTLTPPRGVSLPSGARLLKVMWPSRGQVAWVRSWLAI